MMKHKQALPKFFSNFKVIDMKVTHIVPKERLDRDQQKEFLTKIIVLVRTYNTDNKSPVKKQ
jgi:hypothetical protein